MPPKSSACSGQAQGRSHQGQGRTMVKADSVRSPLRSAWSVTGVSPQPTGSGKSAPARRVSQEPSALRRRRKVAGAGASSRVRVRTVTRSVAAAGSSIRWSRTGADQAQSAAGGCERVRGRRTRITPRGPAAKRNSALAAIFSAPISARPGISRGIHVSPSRRPTTGSRSGRVTRTARRSCTKAASRGLPQVMRPRVLASESRIVPSQNRRTALPGRTVRAVARPVPSWPATRPSGATTCTPWVAVPTRKRRPSVASEPAIAGMAVNRLTPSRSRNVSP